MRASTGDPVKCHPHFRSCLAEKGMYTVKPYIKVILLFDYSFGLSDVNVRMFLPGKDLFPASRTLISFSLHSVDA